VSEMPPSAPHSPWGWFARCAGHLLRLAARVLLGLFVLWQIVFLPAYNVLEKTNAIRKDLAEQRCQDGTWWKVITRVRGLEPLVEEWLNKGANHDDKGTIGNLLRKPQRVVTWWAETTGQEQGWGLFAPNAVDYSAFPSLELRWDDPEQGRALYEPIVLASDNLPRDRRRYLRFGGFRLRRIVTEFEFDTTKLTEAQIQGVVGADSRTVVLAYMRWRLIRFRRENPDLPPPAQVILWVQTFGIPDPPGPRPWDWVEYKPLPLARWLPQKDNTGLEYYSPTKKHFQKPEWSVKAAVNGPP
jgi:hypothetical protein